MDGHPARPRAVPAKTAASWIAEHARTLEFTLPMDADPRPAERIYDQAATRIADELRLDRNVACLCEGDPMFYGSFMYLHARLHTKYPVRIVPGVSLRRGSQRLPWRCARSIGDDRFGVVPASLDDASLRAAASAFETVAFLKVGRHLSRLPAHSRRLRRHRAGRFRRRCLAGCGNRACPLSRAPDAGFPISPWCVLRRGKASSL